MTQLSVTSLISIQTAEQILELGLQVARVLGLPVETWRTGDPTRSLYKYLAEVLETQEQTNSEFIKAGFLSSAITEWLTVLAFEVYNVERIDATFATIADGVTLTNSGGALHQLEVGALTVRNSASGKTYHNTSPGTLSAGATVSFDIIADEAGADSSSSLNEIDDLVTTLLGVAIDSSLAIVGTDPQTDESLRTQSRDTLGALSPNGPSDAYNFVVRDPTKTGVEDITRAQTTNDSSIGVVSVFLAGSTGAVLGASVVAAQAAITQFATPLSITATAINSIEVSTPVTMNISGDDIPGDAAALIGTRLATFFGQIDIGGLIAVSAISREAHLAVPQIETLTVTAPAADVDLADGRVTTLGTVTVIEV